MVKEPQKEKPIAETINVQNDTKIDFEKERFDYKLKKGKSLTQDGFMKLILSIFKKHKKVDSQ